MPHQSVHELVQPGLFDFFKTDEIVLMIDEFLVRLDKWIFCHNIIHEISMDSFRGPGELSNFGFEKQPIICKD